MQENKNEEQPLLVAEQFKGERGVVGTTTPALQIRQMWHEMHFLREKKNAWKRKRGAPSLKRFAKELATSGNEVAKAWLDNKSGAKNQKRSDKNVARVATEKQYTKMSRSKKTQSGKAVKVST